jgi:hypothetical protein
MIRTQFYLPNDLYQMIRLKAEQANKPKAEVVRDLLRRGLDQTPQPTIGEALLGLAELGERLHVEAPSDLSTRIDDYLYGDEE